MAGSTASGISGNFAGRLTGAGARIPHSSYLRVCPRGLCLGRLAPSRGARGYRHRRPDNMEGSASTSLADDSTRECALRDRDAPLQLKSIPRRIMARTLTEEVQVLRFFETGPIDKVEAVFNIICEKMLERVQGRQPAEASMARAGGAGKKR